MDTRSSALRMPRTLPSPFPHGWTHYNYFVIVSRGQSQVDAVQGSDSTYLSGVASTGSTSDDGTDMTGYALIPRGAFTTIGTSL